jgi:hypothetical protein
MAYVSAAAIAVGDLLVGGNVVFTLLLLLVAPYPSALHPPRRVLPLVTVMVLTCIGLGALQHPRARHLLEGFVAALVLAFLAVMTLLYARTTRALSMVMLDVDGFKSINDNFGRPEPRP